MEPGHPRHEANDLPIGYWCWCRKYFRYLTYNLKGVEGVWSLTTDTVGFSHTCKEHNQTLLQNISKLLFVFPYIFANVFPHRPYFVDRTLLTHMDSLLRSVVPCTRLFSDFYRSLARQMSFPIATTKYIGSTWNIFIPLQPIWV